MKFSVHHFVTFIISFYTTVLFQDVFADQTCSIPQTPHNGNYEVEGCEGILVNPFDPPCWKDPSTKFPSGRKVSYFCLAGYVLRGSKKLTCLKSGNWSSPFPKCCKRKRPNSSSGPIVTEAPGQSIPGSSLDVYESAVEQKRAEIPDDVLSCLPLERTKNVEFECRKPDGKLNNCDQLPLPPFTVAHLKCSKYFKSSGDLAYRYRKCKPDGTWSTEGTISCVTDCGKSDSARKPLITNGQASDRGQWPWHVAIYLGTHAEKKEYICGGSLISPQVVLTAAHCVTTPGLSDIRDYGTLTIVLGKHKRLFNDTELNTQIRQPKVIHVSGDYNPLNFEADIAIIVLSSPVQFTFYVRPVCIPEYFNSLIEEYQVRAGNLGTVVGWGLTETGNPSDDLRMAQLPVVSAKSCIDSFASFFQQNKRFTNFCAGYQNGTGVCNGDSGGGMVFPSGEGESLRWYLQGIVSVGAPDPESRGKCSQKEYALFTTVGRFADWIVRTLTPDGYL